MSRAFTFISHSTMNMEKWVQHLLEIGFHDHKMHYRSAFKKVKNYNSNSKILYTSNLFNERMKILYCKQCDCKNSNEF